MALPVSYCHQILNFKKKSECSNILNASVHMHTVHASNVLLQKEVYSRLPISFVFSRGIFFFYPSVSWRKILNRSRLYVYCLIEYFTENTLSELRRSVIARNPLFTRVYIFYVICDLNWSLNLATDYAKQVEHKISQTHVGWERRDAFGADRRIWQGKL